MKWGYIEQFRVIKCFHQVQGPRRIDDDDDDGGDDVCRNAMLERETRAGQERKFLLSIEMRTTENDVMPLLTGVEWHRLRQNSEMFFRIYTSDNFFQTRYIILLPLRGHDHPPRPSRLVLPLQELIARLFAFLSFIYDHTALKGTLLPPAGLHTPTTLLNTRRVRQRHRFVNICLCSAAAAAAVANSSSNHKTPIASIPTTRSRSTASVI